MVTVAFLMQVDLTLDLAGTPPKQDLEIRGNAKSRWLHTAAASKGTQDDSLLGRSLCEAQISELPYLLRSWTDAAPGGQAQPLQLTDGE
jgi:hypothetical protein